MEVQAALPWLFFGAWAFIGAVFLAIARLVRRARLRRLERCTMAAPGTVVEMARRRSSHRSFYHPVVEFSANGQLIRARSSVGSAPPRYAVGEPVTVRWDPANPSRFYLEGDGTPEKVERAMLWAGLGCALAGSLAAMLIGWLQARM